MMNLKTTITILMMLLITSISFAQNAEKILVKAFNLQGNKSVALDLPGKAEVQEWNENYLRVQMTIRIENGSESMLKSLVKVGRYNLNGTAKDGMFDIMMPNIQKTVTVGGRELKESFSYVVYAPSDVNIETNDVTSVSIEEVINAFR